MLYNSNYFIIRRDFMPPTAKITKEMIINAAFEVAEAEGAESINARTVSKRLDCSTQPVMYHFATIEELKKAAYEKTGEFHTEYLLNISKTEGNVMLEIGLNYIRFAVEKPNLFRFLFQSGYAAENSVPEMISSQELVPILSVMQKAMKLNEKQTRDVFLTLAMFVHGYASLIANNSFRFDEELAAAHLKQVYKGAVLAVREEKL